MIKCELITVYKLEHVLTNRTDKGMTLLHSPTSAKKYTTFACIKITDTVVELYTVNQNRKTKK